MIVITGTQRSGTSIMAKFVKECGYDLGTNFWDDRLDGGLESPDVCNYYRDRLGDSSFPFTKYWELVDRKNMFSSFLEIPWEVVKFSYLLMIPRFVYWWYEVRGNKDKFIIMWRSADDVIKSKDSRSDIFLKEDWEGLNMTYEKLLKDRDDSLRLMDELGMEYILVPFPVLSLDVEQLRWFTNLGYLNSDVWNKVYDKSKIHFLKK